MKLVFEQTKNRRQCATEVPVNDFRIQCTFSSSTVVTIPTGLEYVDGKLCFNLNKPSATIPICKNHEMQLNAAFREIYSNKSQTAD